MRITIALLLCLALHAHISAAAPTDIPLSDADEVRIGGLLAAQFAQSEGMQPTPQTTKIDEYVQKVGDRLAAHAHRKLPYRFHYDPNPAFKSALALPGGEIFVGAGILAMMDTEDQLAVVLGHEMEHIDLNQCRDRLVEEMAKQRLTVETANQLKVDSFFPSYGHDREFAADWNGVKLAADAGYSPQAAVRLLNMFVLMDQLTVHTSTEAENNLKERIAQIQRLISEDKLATPEEKPLALPGS
jgi:beta-barrel assembly-enhancing protease